MDANDLERGVVVNDGSLVIAVEFRGAASGSALDFFPSIDKFFIRKIHYLDGCELILIIDITGNTIPVVGRTHFVSFVLAL